MVKRSIIETVSKFFLFAGLVLVLVSLILRINEVEAYYLFLIAGIGLKMVYLIFGLLNRTLAGGRFLVMLIAGIFLVTTGYFLKTSLIVANYAYVMMGIGFALKAYSIVMMVIVGRKNVLSRETPSVRHKY